MRTWTLFILGTILFSGAATAPASHVAAQPQSNETAEVTQYRFKRMHLVRPDLVAFPAAKAGRVC